MEQYPASGWARAQHGWSLLQSGNIAEAQQSFEQALALDPVSSGAVYGLIEAAFSSCAF